jgi:aerobic-type carbon monoxide dehydrogenase small subunit (CoxS/CutS family)
MQKTISFTVNGKKTELTINAGETLLEILRERLHLTGAKQGCGVGECGACAVLVDGIPINACIYLGLWADGREIVTIEGVAKDGELSTVQQAFIAEGAVQCGFCTPGFVITATALLARGKRCEAQEIRQELSGHLCRCTGYQQIIRAVQKALDDEPGSDSEAKK